MDVAAITDHAPVHVALYLSAWYLYGICVI